MLYAVALQEKKIGTIYMFTQQATLIFVMRSTAFPTDRSTLVSASTTVDDHKHSARMTRRNTLYTLNSSPLLLTSHLTLLLLTSAFDHFVVSFHVLSPLAH
jgi:hypothetical protein